MSQPSRDPVRDAQRVKALAREAGFHLAGVARHAPLDPGPLDRWLARGHHADMDWIVRGRDARLDARHLLPSVRSVVSLAVNYWQPGPTGAPGGARISRYAWGRDYHKVLGGALGRLRRALADAFPGVETWGGTDAVPLLEKVWAQRAGLGWIGKSGNLITRELGTWVFLATLLTDLELAPDPPHADQCGTCTACLQACPTGAIVAPREVDARRCLSYQTIEHDRAWPEEITARAGGWIFGCDVCQDVCPYSRKDATPTDVPDFAARPEIRERPLAAWVRLEPGAWDALTRGSALRRPGHRGLVRSALAAAASPGADPEVEAAVDERRADPDPVLRAQAAQVKRRG